MKVIIFLAILAVVHGGIVLSTPASYLSLQQQRPLISQGVTSLSGLSSPAAITTTSLQSPRILPLGLPPIATIQNQLPLAIPSITASIQRQFLPWPIAQSSFPFGLSSGILGGTGLPLSLSSGLVTPTSLPVSSGLINPKRFNVGPSGVSLGLPTAGIL